MTASFELEAPDGVITLPETIRSSFKGKLRVTVSTLSADDEAPAAPAKADFIDFLINNPVEPFTPLTREEANDRYY
ncbi:MAG: hypothetical protein JWO08_4303 [Verrucomicrobiaceae bacterium]|nr:hypothetical protein [Verrucomicrobiaceae bacterium]